MTVPGPVFRANLLIRGEDHVVALYDTEPAGVLCTVINTTTTNRYTRAFSADELKAAKLTKTQADYFHLVESLFFAPSGGVNELQLHSSLAGMRPPVAFATAAAAQHYLTNAQSGNERFSQVLSRGLMMLCKDKPMGLQAITRLGKWLLENNPNKPKVVVKK
ncbi:hypothetical protein H257_00788 [Aphanomyces astaci]|uniref:Uncharacterized protein n=1 Tax=Aphanomyces astaci TaxID=112090 RepID=W4HE35_APHAT|nr:hypothetical protein H257_00788 [Aphanomyces astaci]ETV89554.1 hypothetical protein H257_00788 [Aphanomyces astaci]RHY06789.1 hypothetical protein DYB36_000441 [Aphanomyces astaci]RHY17971.1 hypothetical protein DYB25_000142 [Aphanomyces astaci]RHY72362.1 hypothetical protein DYB34_001710 [Aphanomyces astaci]RHY82308.1 hypothetical protein DYB35_000734 [Aphanomyces astaci]|eukprot:XP_009821954.1 hypothetical protein H257_00788 [Aphanomyces astaci]